MKMAIGMWSWWSERNGIREEGKRIPVPLIVNFVRSLCGGDYPIYVTRAKR
jgi:hypothetical protein